MHNKHRTVMGIVGLLATAAVIAGGCGSTKPAANAGGGNSGAATTMAPGTTQANGPATTNSPATTTTSCIPQGGGGDGDADNFGGPSDGDGCQ
ncbi:MAG TPA: hypothetical protein VKR22_04100 [Acidimicrobiales bacterium]|nr:hypothetical protein [Acidimicrobiales bacterium]